MNNLNYRHHQSDDERSLCELRLHKELQEQLLMKEKAMIFSDYHQPYNFISHEEPAAEPVDSSTPLPVKSKTDSYPRRHRHPMSYEEDTRGKIGFNMQKHNSESAPPLQTLSGSSGSPEDRRTTTPSKIFNLIENSVQEEPLEKQRLAKDSVRTQFPNDYFSTLNTDGVVTPKSKKKFSNRKRKDNLDSVEDVDETASSRRSEVKKKKKLFGRNTRSASQTSLDVIQENPIESGEKIQPRAQPLEQDKRLESKPPISPAKKKLFKGSNKKLLATKKPEITVSDGVSYNDMIAEEEPEKRASSSKQFSDSKALLKLVKKAKKQEDAGRLL